MSDTKEDTIVINRISLPTSTSSIREKADDTSTTSIDPLKEKACLRKFDRIVLPQCFIILLVNFLDRSNIGNARVFGFEKSLGLSGNQFGNINTFFFIPYILFETPWVMAVKRFGPNRVLFTAVVGWSLVTLFTGFIQNYAQAIVVRMLLGAFEAGVAPAFGFFFTSVYGRESVAKRIALINGANAVSGAFGGLFSYGVQSMGTRRGLEAWRWLFILEGIGSMVVCSLCLYSFPNKPETAWFFNAEEKEVMRMRKERDAVFKGDDKFDKKWIKLAATDPFVYCAGAAFICSSVAIFGFGLFLPTIIRGLGFSAFQANYLTIPVYALGAASLFTQAYLSDKLQKRALFLLISAIPVTAGYLICVGNGATSGPPGIGYAAMFICVTGIYSFSCLMITWVATNLMPDYKRSVGLPIFSSIGNCSGFISTQLYPSRDGPAYIMGHAASAGFEVAAVGFVGLTLWLLRRRNVAKERLVAEGFGENGREGDEALGFRYTL